MVSFGKGSGKRLLHEDGFAERSNPLRPLPVVRCRGTWQDQIRFCPLHANAIVGEEVIRRQAELSRRVGHPLRLLVANPHDITIRMLEGHPQVVTRVEMVKVDARNAESRHFRLPCCEFAVIPAAHGLRLSCRCLVLCQS